jgi:hypothetical protein
MVGTFNFKLNKITNIIFQTEIILIARTIFRASFVYQVKINLRLSLY